MIAYWQTPTINVPAEAFQTELGVVALIIIAIMIAIGIIAWAALRPMNTSIGNLKDAWSETRKELAEEKKVNGEYREKLAHNEGFLEGVKVLIDEIPNLRERIRELDEGLHQKDKSLAVERTHTEAVGKSAETVRVEFTGALKELTAEIRGWRADLEADKQQREQALNQQNEKVIDLLTVISERLRPAEGMLEASGQ